MKRGHGLSWVILILCIVLVMQIEPIISWASRLIKEDYKLSNQVYFNLNNDFEHRAQIFTVDNAFVIVGRTAVQYISKAGDVIWEKDVSSQNVSVAPGKKVFALAEKKAGDVFIINQSGEIIAKHFGLGAIETIKLFNDQYVGVIKSDGEYVLLDKNLKTISSTTLPTGTVIDYDLDINNQNSILVILDLSRKAFNSKLVIISFNGNIISGSNIEQEIAYDIILYNNHIRILVDTGMLVFGYDGKKMEQKSMEQTIGAFAQSDGFWVYLVNSVNQSTVDEKPERFVKMDAKGEVIHEFSPPFTPIKQFRQFGEQLLLFNEEKVSIVDVTGKVIETYPGSEKIKAVHPLGTEGFAIEYINHLDIYLLK